MYFNKKGVKKMRIKAYLENGDFKIIGVLVTDDIKKIANKYERWEYIL